MIEKYIRIEKFVTDSMYPYENVSPKLALKYAYVYNHLDNFLQRINLPEEFYEGLSKIGGQSRYHNEGNALVHTLLVTGHCISRHNNNLDLWATIGLLHDIGKIYTGKKKPNGDFEYPMHSMVGSYTNVLSKFLSRKDKNFKTVKWFIQNHIKPLFWSEEDYASFEEGPTEFCTTSNLLELVTCDLMGSIGNTADSLKRMNLFKQMYMK